MKKQFTDHLKRELTLNFPPKRIVSLVPSQTELLFDLGLEEEIVGITKFCIHPKSKCKTIEKIGGTKNFNFKKIKSLKPDLIIANKEENYKDGIETLAKDFPVWVSDIYNLADNLKMIAAIGELTNRKSESVNIIDTIERNFGSLQITQQKKVAYLIWNHPMMTINSNTYINEMLKLSGFDNVFEKLNDRYPAISTEQLKEANPDYIFLSSEPYPFKEKHKLEFQEIYTDAKVMIVDGEMFSWYGSRSIRFSEYINKQLKPQLWH